jgi:hypothetical protein
MEDFLQTAKVAGHSRFLGVDDFVEFLLAPY